MIIITVVVIATVVTVTVSNSNTYNVCKSITRLRAVRNTTSSLMMPFKPSRTSDASTRNAPVVVLVVVVVVSIVIVILAVVVVVIVIITTAIRDTNLKLIEKHVVLQQNDFHDTTSLF